MGASRWESVLNAASGDLRAQAPTYSVHQGPVSLLTPPSLTNLFLIFHQVSPLPAILSTLGISPNNLELLRMPINMSQLRDEEHCPGKRMTYPDSSKKKPGTRGGPVFCLLLYRPDASPQAYNALGGIIVS